MVAIIGYQVARRQGIGGPWFTDWDDGVIHATEEDAQAAADLAQRTTGYPWELLPVYDEEPDPGPVIPPQGV